jgi:hypothetical protein
MGAWERRVSLTEEFGKQGTYMSKQICRCCGGEMISRSSRNPNLCTGCEQLLEDDFAELERLLKSVRAEHFGPDPRPPKDDSNQSNDGILFHSA